MTKPRNKRRVSLPFGLGERELSPGIERLFVALLLGLLLAVVLAGVSGFRRKADKTACVTDMVAFEQAAENYSAQQVSMTYPKDFAAFTPLLRHVAAGEISPDGLVLAKQGYSLRYDPSTGHVTGTLKTGVPCRLSAADAASPIEMQPPLPVSSPPPLAAPNPNKAS